jgi:hypothetical protein
LRLESRRKNGFADFALKIFPEEHLNSRLVLTDHFCFDPRFQALKVDKAHPATTAAARNERVCVVVIVAPAKSAVSLGRILTNLIFGLIRILLFFCGMDFWLWF